MVQTNPQLSKSRFIAGLQCHKRLYWEIHNRELMAPVDDVKQAVFDQGNEVGELARQAFPTGILIDESHFEHAAAVAQTKSLITQSDVEAIYEAAFTFDDVKVRVDILVRLPGDQWHVIEVKSTTKVKDYHLWDSAVQRYVVEGSGLHVSCVSLMHLNREYVYEGGAYDVDALFAITPVDDEIEDLVAEIPSLLAAQKVMIRKDLPPVIEAGDHCTDPFECPFLPQCNEPPLKHGLHTVPRLGAAKKAELASSGISTVHEIPIDFPLSSTQKRVVEAVRSEKPYIGDQLGSVIDELKYPLFFMDFETHFPAIPRYSGLRPFDHYPFQWSVHIQQAPGADLDHVEYLATDAADGRARFVEQLLGVLESAGGQGHIVVYNAGFENQRLDELAAFSPDHEPRIRAVQDRIWDLLTVIRSHYYHPEFQGSYSIKKVLPALVPAMSYEHMEIGEGSLAAIMFARMIHPDTDPGEKGQIEAALRAYCQQDTLAMYRVLEALREIAR